MTNGNALGLWALILIAGVGVGVPGIIDERGRTIRWPQSLGEKDVSVCLSIKDTFEKRLNVPTFVENDANAAVLGEKWLGLDRDVKHLVYMFSGVGVGIIINGELYRGATGAAGELGISSLKASREEILGMAVLINCFTLSEFCMRLLITIFTSTPF